MDMSNTCKLIKHTYTTDSYKVKKETDTERTVFCSIKSVSGVEWHEAGRNGIKAQYQLTMFKYDYQNEETVKIGNVKYQVYRTYSRQDDFIELYLERRAGA